MKLLFLILIGVVSYKIIVISKLLLSSGNLEKISNIEFLEHKTQNCEISYFDVINSNYSNGKVYVLKINRKRMDFEVSKKPLPFDFYINANFFSYKPLGEVMINKKIVNRKNSGGGFFISKNGIFDITTYSRPKGVDFSSQTNFIGIKNGKINTSVLKGKWSKSQYYRIMIGKDYENNLIVLHSDRYGLISIKNLCDVGLKVGIKDGLIFDGGSSVDVKLRDGIYNHSFQALPDLFRLFRNNVTPPIYISGNFK